MTREEVAKDLQKMSKELANAARKLRTGGKLSEIRLVVYDADRFSIPSIISRITDLEFEEGRSSLGTLSG